MNYIVLFLVLLGLLYNIGCNQEIFVQTGDEIKIIENTNNHAPPLNEGIPKLLPDIMEIWEYDEFHNSVTPSQSYALPIRFEPMLLEFFEKSLGIPHTAEVMIKNESPNKAVHLNAISGNSIHFHPSFFKEKILEPGYNTSFMVTFLAREIGNVENSLVVHTSFGQFKYQVFGTGIPNPYRVRAYYEGKIPHNTIFSPIINMFNPHTRAIQITEIFASSGDFHMELPYGFGLTSSQIWKIASFETKPLVISNFLGRLLANTTCYVGVKVEIADQLGKPHSTRRNAKFLLPKPPALMIIPFDISVVSEPGLYSSVDVLDFGTLSTYDTPKVIKLKVYNHGPSVVHVTGVTLSPLNDAVTIDFSPIKIPANTKKPIIIASVTFLAFKAVTSKHWNGKIKVHSKSNIHKLSIPYTANVLKGALLYDHNNTKIYVSGFETEPIKRHIPVQNTFDFPLAISHITFDKDPYNLFKISKHPKPLVIPAKQSYGDLYIEYRPKKSFDIRQKEKKMHYLTSSLSINTNASKFKIPITIYYGGLHVVTYSVESQLLDFGYVPCGSSKDLVFSLINYNPYDVDVQALRLENSREPGSSPVATQIFLARLEEITNASFTLEDTMPKIMFPITQNYGSLFPLDSQPGPEDPSQMAKVLPHSKILVGAFKVAHFVVQANAPDNREGSSRATIVIESLNSLRAETLNIPVHLSFGRGDVSLFHNSDLPSPPDDPSNRGKCNLIDMSSVLSYPGKISKRNLLLYNRFDREMVVTHVTGYLNDHYPVFDYVRPRDRRLVLSPNAFSYIGQIQFDPLKACETDEAFCYLGLSNRDAEYESWCSLLASPNDMVDVDIPLYSKLRAKWQELQNHGMEYMNSTFIIDTNEYNRVLSFMVKGRLTWPKLVTEEELTFPLTKVNNYSAAVIILRNPSYLPLILHIVPITAITNGPEKILNALLFDHDQTDYDSALFENEATRGQAGTAITNLELAEIYMEDGYGESYEEHGSQANLVPSRRALENGVGFKPHSSTLGYLLRPGQEARFLVKFSPFDTTQRTTALLIRNNLTILEAIRIRGKGGNGRLELVDLSTMETQDSIISFHLNERHLKNCFLNVASTLQSYTMRKTFIAKNTGDLPLTISSTRVNDVPCQAYGFRILDCVQGRFMLEPNESRRMDLAFTPDFSVSKITRHLSVYVDYSRAPVNYLLVATVPAYLINQCASKVARPDWEIVLYYSTLGSMAVLFLFVILVSWIEADRITRFHWLSMSLDRLTAVRNSVASTPKPSLDKSTGNSDVSCKPQRKVSSPEHPETAKLNITAPGSTPTSPCPDKPALAITSDQPLDRPSAAGPKVEPNGSLAAFEQPAGICGSNSSNGKKRESGETKVRETSKEKNKGTAEGGNKWLSAFQEKQAKAGKKGSKTRHASRDETRKSSWEDGKPDKGLEKCGAAGGKKQDGDGHKHSKKWADSEAASKLSRKAAEEAQVSPNGNHHKHANPSVGLTKTKAADKKGLPNGDTPTGTGKPKKSNATSPQNSLKVKESKASGGEGGNKGALLTAQQTQAKGSNKPAEPGWTNGKSNKGAMNRTTSAISSTFKDNTVGSVKDPFKINTEAMESDTQTFSQLISSWHKYQQTFQQAQPAPSPVSALGPPAPSGDQTPKFNAWDSVNRKVRTPPGLVPQAMPPFQNPMNFAIPPPPIEPFLLDNVRSLTPTNVGGGDKKIYGPRFTGTPVGAYENSVASDSRSQTPVWDLPEVGIADADFGALAEQTLHFEEQYGSPSHPGRGLRESGAEFPTFSLFPSKMDLPVNQTPIGNSGMTPGFGLTPSKWSQPIVSSQAHWEAPSAYNYQKRDANFFKLSSVAPYGGQKSNNPNVNSSNVPVAWNSDIAKRLSWDNRNHSGGSVTPSHAQQPAHNYYSYEYPDASRNPFLYASNSPRKGDPCLSRSSSWDSIVAEVQNEKSRMESYVATQQLNDQFAKQQHATATFYSLLQSYLDDPGFQEYLKQQRQNEGGNLFEPSDGEYYNMQVPFDTPVGFNQPMGSAIRRNYNGMGGAAGDYFNLRLPSNVFSPKGNESSEQTLKNIRQKCQDWLFSINAPPFKPGQARPLLSQAHRAPGASIPPYDPTPHSNATFNGSNQRSTNYLNLADIWRKNGDL